MYNALFDVILRSSAKSQLQFKQMGMLFNTGYETCVNV